MTTRTSYTAVLERNTVWEGSFATEPYEGAWASEAVFFVRTLAAGAETTARVQISPDGIHWCDEGTLLTVPGEAESLAFCRVSHFGGWLRLAGTIPAGQKATVIVYLCLKE
ncbi:MAG: hypothetical protein IPM16_10895 [Chloroflexi bacterium]|nr:hypothetical protein [Chloroflexota bacterium]